jgi:hypothetical protein
VSTFSRGGPGTAALSEAKRRKRYERKSAEAA